MKIGNNASFFITFILLSTFFDVTYLDQSMGGKQRKKETGRSYFGFNGDNGKEIQRAHLLYAWLKSVINNKFI